MCTSSFAAINVITLYWVLMRCQGLLDILSSEVDQMTLPGKYYLPLFQKMRVRVQVALHLSPQPVHLKVSEITERCEMDFSSQRKAKNLTEENLPSSSWGSSERALQHLFTCYWGAKCEENWKSAMTGMSLGGELILLMRRDGGRSWLPRGASHLTPFQWALGEDPKQGVLVVLPTGKQGWGLWTGPLHPRTWQAASKLTATSPNAKMNSQVQLASQKPHTHRLLLPAA